MKGKLYAAALFAAMLILAGCTKGRDSGNAVGSTAERMEISIAVWDVDKTFRGDPVLEAIEEKFGVTFKPVKISWDDYYQKIERWAATDSLPDLFAGDFRNTAQYIQWINQGLLSPIPDDLSAYPHLEKYMKESGKSQMVAVDGKYYCIPRQTYPSQAWTSIDRIIAYRWDLAQKAGITKEPENWEEFQEMILAIIREDPEHTGIQGMTIESPDTISGILLPYASSVVFHWKLYPDGFYKPVYFTEDLTGAFQLGRDMYESGVIERDVILQTPSTAQDKFLQGKNAAILYPGGFGGNYGDMSSYWVEHHGHDYTEDVKALKLMLDQNGNKAYPIWGYAWSESYISAKASEEKVNKILQIYDYLLSDEGAFFGTYGPEGSLYELVDGRVQMYDADTYVQDTYPSCGTFGMLVRWHPSAYDDRFVPDVPRVYDEINRELVHEAETVPIPAYEPECLTILQESQIDFFIDMGDDFLRIMTGTEPVEQMWEAIRQEYEEKGLQDVIEMVNARMSERKN